MKNALLSTTALIAASAIGAAAASPASAENEKISLRLGGYMEQWIGYSSQDDVVGTDTSGPGQASDTEIFFLGSTTLDNGITFGVNIQLEGNTNTGDQIDESYLTIGGDFGLVYLGDENSAQYKMHYTAPDVGIGANSGDQTIWAAYTGGAKGSYFRGPFGSTTVEANRVNDTFRVSYFTPRFSGFQFGASYAPVTEQDSQGSIDRDAELHDGISFGANFVESFNGVEVGVSGGYGRWDNPLGADPEVYSLGLSLGFSGFTVGGSYANQTDDTVVGDAEGWELGVSYGTGPWGVSLNYYHGERDGVAALTAEHDTFMGSVAYSMGPGIKVVATLGYTDIDDQSPGGAGDNESTYFVLGPKLSF